MSRARSGRPEPSGASLGLRREGILDGCPLVRNKFQSLNQTLGEVTFPVLKFCFPEGAGVKVLVSYPLVPF